ncbi:hypothetical protein [Nostoc sp. 'Peltigera malacea cyanobiont' DB3992]|uniref:hypothetical protein n=1 Tax=Nostoc sp. 'Peltigera malacea cyanobiont' DB3992 TaxID=1206980 RepID=UPI00117CBA80|nr:hypothetical protein [Nostoc sp. 'Peltigera malacea cyanobiont' DB3992]
MEPESNHVVPLAYGTLRERGSKLRAASVYDTLRERREVRVRLHTFISIRLKVKIWDETA